MKDTTITLPENVARWLCVEAAADDRSISRWIAELPAGIRHREDEHESAMRRALSIEPRRIEWPEGRKPTREGLYDRPGLR